MSCAIFAWIEHTMRVVRIFIDEENRNTIHCQELLPTMIAGNTRPVEPSHLNGCLSIKNTAVNA